MRGRGEPLKQLVEVDTLVHWAYPTVREDMVSFLVKEWFVDTLQDMCLHLGVKLAHHRGVQEELMWASNMKTYPHLLRQAWTWETKNCKADYQRKESSGGFR